MFCRVLSDWKGRIELVGIDEVDGSDGTDNSMGHGESIYDGR